MDVTGIRPAPISPTRPVPGWIPRPHYVGRAAPEPYRGPHVQTVETIERMRVAGRIAAQAARVGAAAVAPGVTTDAIDAVVHAFLIDQGAYPSTLGYRGFPKSCCTSVNEVICHGIPDARPLEDGDLVKIDVTAFVDRVHGDTCLTVCCGDVDTESRLLSERTEEALRRAIAAVKPGRQVNVLGRVIESYAKRFGYHVIRDYTGHGVHSSFHSGLVIPHYDSPLPRHGDRAGHDLHHRADARARHPRVGAVGRRLDRADPGRLPLRPVRAHPGGHRLAAPRSSRLP